jgi:type IV pilus assembly protein PilM
LLEASVVTWRRSARGTIGIDIGQQAVALVAVRHAAAGPRVEEAAAAEVPAGALHGHAVREPAAVGAAIRRLRRRRIVPRSWPVVTAIPAAGAMVRRLTVAAAAGAALDAAVVAAAAAVVPDGVEHAVLDYHVLRATDRATDVLVVAARRELVRGYTDAVRAAGLEPAAVDVDVLAVQRAWVAAAAAGVAPVVLLRIGARGISAALLRGEVPTIGGDVPALAAVDADTLGAAVVRAVDLLLPDPAERRCTVVVWGTAARVAALAPVLEAHLRCPVAVLDPFVAWPLAPRLRRVVPVAAGPGFAVAAGLALRVVERPWW